MQLGDLFAAKRIRKPLAVAVCSLACNAMAVCPAYVLSNAELSKILSGNFAGAGLVNATASVLALPSCDIQLDASVPGIFSARGCAEVLHTANELGLKPFKVKGKLFWWDEERDIKPSKTDVSTQIVMHCGYQAKISRVTPMPGQIRVEFLD